MPESQIKVEYNYHCGDDLAVVNAARRSFGKKSEWDYEYIGIAQEVAVLKPKDKKLLEFLARGISTADWHEFVASIAESGADGRYVHIMEDLWKWRNTPTHDTPFNHCFISFDVAAPIFVARQLVKHEYLIMSEFSRRYMADDVEFYVHEYRDAPEDKKQGSGGKNQKWNHGVGTGYMETVYEHYENSLALYQHMLSDGVAPEQARGILPQDLMTSWTWSGTLGAFAKMCRERLDPHAQYETRLVARQVYDYLKEHYPVSAPLLVEGSR